jgi:hypothetical protein
VIFRQDRSGFQSVIEEPKADRSGLLESLSGTREDISDSLASSKSSFERSGVLVEGMKPSLGDLFGPRGYRYGLKSSL